MKTIKVMLLFAGILISMTANSKTESFTSSDLMFDEYCASTVNSCGAIHLCGETVDDWIEAYELTNFICWLHPGVRSIQF